MKQANKTDNKTVNKAPNIFKKMFLSFIVIPVIPIVALLLLAYSSQKEGTELAEKNLINAAEIIGVNIDKWVEKNVFVSNLASDFDDIISMDPERQKPILTKIKENSNAITAVRIDNAEGMAVSRSDNKSLKNYSDRAYFKQVQAGAPVGQQVIFGRTQQKPILCFTVPIDDEGEFTGTLNQCATLDDISNNVTNLEIGNSGFAFLIDRNKQLIATGNKGKNLSDNLEDMSNHPAIKDGKLDELFSYDDDGEKIAYKTSVGLDWILVVQQDYKEAFAAPLSTKINTIIAVLITAVACLLFVYFLSKSISAPLQEARQETDNILSSVNDGLFLIDKDYVIGSQQSSNLSQILQKDDLSGTSFARYLSDAVPIDIAILAKDYIDLLFSDRIKEQLVQTRNPLKLVKTSVENRDGELTSRYLSLTFKRVYEGSEISNLLVTAKDITQETLLKAELEKLKEEKNQQVNLLAEILYIPSDTVRKFLVDTNVTLNKINDVLEQPGSTSADYTAKTNSIFRLIHKVKGDASAINFELFANECHSFEEVLSSMRQQTNDLSGNEFLPVTIALEELFKNCHVVGVLMDKVGAFGSGGSFDGDTDLGTTKDDSEEHESDQKEEWYQLRKMAKRVAEKYDKEVEVHFQGFTLDLPEEYHEGFKDIATQLIRNSIVHGIEDADIREDLYKVKEGQIIISLRHSDKDGYSLIYKDDGKGVNFQRVRQMVVEKDLVSEEKAAKLGDQDLLAILFKHGFSLANEVNVDAGRGVGLPLVIEKAKELGGKIKVASYLNKGFALKVTLPEHNSTDTPLKAISST